ncbi:AAA family ATPase, partial [Phytoactinopolyspora endophytica]|uniref:AAA family ATPase n=1 Tax=Phytoactinopolyspora endophytica TaxID=1642495 RepID=UPI001F0EE83A
MKDLIVQLCRRPDVSLWQIIYFPADNMTDQDLRRSFALGRDLTRSAGNQTRIWLVDEITSVADWTTTVKSLRDNTPMARDTVILTGSSATSSAAALRDLGAGRAGDTNTNPFRLLLPMSFSEFVHVTDPAIPRLDVVAPWELQAETVAQTAAEMDPFTDLLDLAWQRYLECGGFPRAVGEHTRAGAVSETFARDLVAWLRTDVDPDGPQESVPLLLDALHQGTTSPINIRATSERVGVSRGIFERRLNRLIHAFGALQCPQRNDTGALVASAQSKIYLIDPVFAQIAAAVRPGLGQRDFTALTEAVIATTLARVIDAASPGRLVDGDTIGYARTDRGREVDLCPVPITSPDGARLTTPIESKWVSSGWRS